MIPINMIKEWRQQAPWVLQSQVEQDLILSRALIALYQEIAFTWRFQLERPP